MNPKEKIKQLESYWRKHIAQFKRAHISQKAYCAKHDLIAHQFTYWKTRIRQLSADSKSAKGNFTKIQVQHNPVISNQNLRLTLNLSNGIGMELELDKIQDLIDIIHKLES